MSAAPRFRSFGDTAFGVEFATTVDRAANARVMALHAAVKAARERGRLAGVIEAIPSFGALVVQYDPLQTSRADLEQAVSVLIADLKPAARQGRLWRLPVCYDPALAPDLADVAAQRGLTPDAVAERHAAATYFIYMLGFMPGLAYMGGLDAALHLPRRSAPRLKVPPGSVAIAEAMTTIYPFESPGGWHLIGRTAIRLFDAARAAPILYGAGDEVRFHPVSRRDYDAQLAAVAAGQFDYAALEAKR